MNHSGKVEFGEMLVGPDTCPHPNHPLGSVNRVSPAHQAETELMRQKSPSLSVLLAPTTAV